MCDAEKKPTDLNIEKKSVWPYTHEQQCVFEMKGR